MIAENKELIEEQEEIRKRNKGEDKKALLPFLLMLVVSMFIGGLFGYFSADTKEGGAEAVLEAVRSLLSVSTPYVLFICIAGIVFFGYGVFYKRQKEYRQGLRTLDEEKMSELQDKIEYGLNLPMIVITAAQITGFFEMTVVLVCMGKENLLESIIATAEFAITLALGIILSAKLVNFEKEMNPEKRGSVFSTDFQKTWINSCDEMEKSTIYEACYFSYRVSSGAYLVLWVVLSFAAVALDLGILPAAVVIILWAVQVFSYYYKVLKAEKEKYRVR